MNILIAESDTDIRRCFEVMKELRPHLINADDFLSRVRRQQEQSGWQLIYVEDEGEPVACAGFRISEWLAWNKTLYVDDLICQEGRRNKGYASALMRWMRNHAKQNDCEQFHLDSGTHRLVAHRFYHGQELAIEAFHFATKL